ncbi:hypothetical protein [Rhodopirellula sp. P2]|uniref:hypothetical protein n=1 Tax=Rhodopirellula sp. P2 TaxID=2127060 RepID=UPI0023675583|nr:hypothetical protein [Rhodopirellula sp. P2]WDQ14668.1 hypothetical protein PSR62_13545 [Rhodopirellula sp. P2]
MDLPPDHSSAQLPTNQGWFQTWRAVDRKSFAAGLGGLLIWLASCIVLGLGYLAILEEVILGLMLASVFCGFMFIASAWGGLRWLRYWGWTLQHARGHENSAARSLPNQVNTDSTRSTAESGSSA